MPEIETFTHRPISEHFGESAATAALEKVPSGHLRLRSRAHKIITSQTIAIVTIFVNNLAGVTMAVFSVWPVLKAHRLIYLQKYPNK